MRKFNKPRGKTFSLSSKKEFDYIEWADIFMQRYGMNFHDFENIPIPTFWALLGIIKKESEENKKKYGK